MIARSLAVGVLVLSAAVLQTSLFPALTLLGFRPDLLLLVVVALAVQDGPVAGALVGAVAGLVTDLLVAQAPLGLAVLVYTVVGHAAGLARPYLAPGSITAPLLLAFASGALATAAYGGLAGLLADEGVPPTLLLQASLSVALYNTLLAPLVLALVRRVSERLPLGAGAGLD